MIAAPTGSGKTLAAFLACIDRLLRDALDGNAGRRDAGRFTSRRSGALSNDIHRNLDVPLEGLRQFATAAGYKLPIIRAAVRTGDTPPSQRQALLRHPPHILVTTPESLYLMLTSAKSRETLRSVRTVIVDEIHALARDKRGSHLALSLERLECLCRTSPVRIGLSATQSPIERIASIPRWGRREDAARPPRLARSSTSGHIRELDLKIDVPPSELSAVCSNEQWGEVYEQLAGRVDHRASQHAGIRQHAAAGRARDFHHLSGNVGRRRRRQPSREPVRGELRHSAEERLKTGQLRAIVATASLEMGIDVGYLDLVCQIGSPRSIATFLQRVGRSGHLQASCPKAGCFRSRATNWSNAWRWCGRFAKSGRLDQDRDSLYTPLDILAQQIVVLHDGLRRLVRRRTVCEVCRAGIAVRTS